MTIFCTHYLPLANHSQQTPPTSQENPSSILRLIPPNTHSNTQNNVLSLPHLLLPLHLPLPLPLPLLPLLNRLPPRLRPQLPHLLRTLRRRKFRIRRRKRMERIPAAARAHPDNGPRAVRGQVFRQEVRLLG